MGFPLSRDDVEKHLKDLGYRNITDDQLNEFIKDLKRLIRFEEKQSRLKSLIQLRKDEYETKKLQHHQQQQEQHRQQRRSGRKSVEQTSPRSSLSSSSGHFSEFDQEPPLQQRHKRHEQTTVQHRRRSISYRYVENNYF